MPPVSSIWQVPKAHTVCRCHLYMLARTRRQSVVVPTSSKSREVAVATASPTVRRRELGARLRALRTGAGMTVDDAAARMEVSPAKISRIETGARGVSITDVRFLCDLYQVTAEERDRLLDLTRESKRRSWWQQYGLPESLATYIG